MNGTGGLRRTLLRCAFSALFVSASVSAFAQTQAQPGTELQDGLRAYSQRNFAAAWRAWTPLAQRGDPTAQYNLGRLYARGEGVSRDLPEAYKWFTLAANGGRREGEQARQAISRIMTPVQMAEGLRRAEALRRQQQR
jgi:TPR repeat protein